jgi:hypothetical protein
MASQHSTSATPIRDWKWSSAEKASAQRAFDRALRRELDAVHREAKKRVARITEPAQRWELERWLGERRRQIARNFDYFPTNLRRSSIFVLRSRSKPKKSLTLS